MNYYPENWEIILYGLLLGGLIVILIGLSFI